jgi:hypothetical protein
MLFPFRSRVDRLRLLLLRVAIRIRDLVDRAKLYLRAHLLRAALFTIGASTLILLVLFWPFWAKAIPRCLAALAITIVEFARRHPDLSRLIHVSVNAIPDLAFVLLALAGLSYLMPELMAKFQASKALRLSAFVLFLAFGLSVVIVDAVNREYQERQQQADRNKIDALNGQVHDTLQFLVQSRGQPNELERRKHILDTLRSEYIVTHPEDSAAVIAGDADPPADWVNRRLRELGERWPYVPPARPAVTPPPRSYVVWSGIPKFASGDHEGDPITVGHPIAFNIHFKQQGPNPVEILESHPRWLFVEPNDLLDTQKAAIQNFTNMLKVENNLPGLSTTTMVPGENGRFFSAGAMNETRTGYRPATQGDLDDLRDGKEFVFILALITYRDRGDRRKEHHLSLCLYLQPPAKPPGVWHLCAAGFNNSD